MRGNLPPSSEDDQATPRPGVERTVTELPHFAPAPPVQQSNRLFGSAGHARYGLANDGVFANLNAKPELGEKLEEQPPVGFCPYQGSVGQLF